MFEKKSAHRELQGELVLTIMWKKPRNIFVQCKNTVIQSFKANKKVKFIYFKLFNFLLIKSFTCLSLSPTLLAMTSLISLLMNSFLTNSLSNSPNCCFVYGFLLFGRRQFISSIPATWWWCVGNVVAWGLNPIEGQTAWKTVVNSMLETRFLSKMKKFN